MNLKNIFRKCSMFSVISCTKSLTDFNLLLSISTTILFCRYFARDKQSPHVKTLLISKCSHLFWEGLFLDMTSFFLPTDNKIVSCKVGNILYYSMGIQCSKIYYLSQCAYSYEGGNIKKKLGLSLEDTLNLFVN